MYNKYVNYNVGVCVCAEDALYVYAGVQHTNFVPHQAHLLFAILLFLFGIQIHKIANNVFTANASIISILIAAYVCVPKERERERAKKRDRDRMGSLSTH